MERSELRQLMPFNSKDVERAESFIKLEYPTIAPMIPEMIKGLGIYQSPVAKIYCQFFVEQQDHLRRQIDSALGKTKNFVIRHMLLTEVISFWREENIRDIVRSLYAACGSIDDYFHTDLIALNMLVTYKISTEQYRRSLIEQKEGLQQERIAMLADLRKAEYG